jgi:ABC-type transport system substrate-binding protein
LVGREERKMKGKTVSQIILWLIFTSTLAFASPIQQIRVVSEAVAQTASIPPFVAENKLIYEAGTTYQWLDPHVAYYQYDYWTLWHSVETLFWYERDNATKIIPWLAESYTITADGLHYDLTLRQGITFQDGTPFNATAVWFSLNRLLIIDGTSGDGFNHGTQAAWIIQQLLDPDLSYYFSGHASLGGRTSYNATFVKTILDKDFVEIFDPYHLRLNLDIPSTQFLPIMAGPWASIVSPVATIQLDYAHGGWGTWDGDYTNYFLHMAGNGQTGLVLPQTGWRIGTGPYYVDSVQPATPYTIVLKAYDNYWGGPNDMNLPPAGKTRIATVEFNYVPSFATRLLDLKAGTATAIAVPTDSIFQVVDRDKWLDQGILESIIPGITEHGPFSQFTTWWLNFDTNVTRVDGALRNWQPFADWRIRMAVACSVNMTNMNTNINSKLGIVASSIIPPNTFPQGSYNPNIEPEFSFNLTRVNELLLAANGNPMTTFNYYNGSAVPPGIIDNSFGPDFVHAKTVEFYVQAGATVFQQVLVAMADNLNQVAQIEDLGIRFNVVIVPGGQQYTLASAHLIDSYIGGWIADYNHVLDWLIPMYLSTGVYPSWNLWNLSAMDYLLIEAVAADQAGDIPALLAAADQMNTVANNELMYMVWWHPTMQFTRSSWLKGWWVNSVYGVDIWSTMYYEIPDTAPPTTTISLSGAAGSDGWFISNVTVTLSATDDYEVDSTEYSFNNVTWTTYTSPFNITEEGRVNVYYKSIDKAGNEETTKVEEVKIDKTSPTGTIMIKNDDAYTTSTLAILTLASTDFASGVDKMRLSNDGAWDTEPWQSFSPFEIWILPSGDGTKTVYVQYGDAAGWVSQSYSDTIVLDTTPPEIAITYPIQHKKVKSSLVTVTWTASDETSGTSHFEIRLDDGSWIDVGMNTSYMFTGVSVGIHVVEVKAYDQAGLSSVDSVGFKVRYPHLGRDPQFSYEVTRFVFLDL